MINSRARNEAKKIAETARGNPTAERLGNVALACPLDNLNEAQTIYDNLRPEIYGRLMPIIVGTVDYAYQEAANRPPFGIRSYRKKDNASALNWKNIENSLYNSLKLDAEELFIHNPKAQELYIEPLRDLLQCASSLVYGAHNEPAVAISYGLDTAVSSSVSIAHSMHTLLLSKYPAIDERNRTLIILRSKHILKQLAVSNLEQIDVLGKLWYSQSALVNDLEYLEEQNIIALKYGQINKKTISTVMAQNSNLRSGCDPSSARIGDLEKPFSHIGCPISFEPNYVDKLWKWEIGVMEKGGLFKDEPFL